MGLGALSSAGDSATVFRPTAAFPSHSCSTNCAQLVRDAAAWKHAVENPFAGLDVSCKSMQTPEQLRDRLRELGIARDLRTLTDWRQKGLIPPLQSASRGRGRGVKRYWSDDVLDQAIAADWLLKRCGSTGETLFGLWLAGYAVDHAAAQQAWIHSVERLQHRRQQAASRYSGRFPGLARSWWKRLRSRTGFTSPWWRELPAGDQERISSLLGDTLEWLRDDEERDDDAYRYAIAELIIESSNTNRRKFYRRFDRMWADADPASLFAITPYLELVRSMSPAELTAAHKSLARVASMLRRVVELSGSDDRVGTVVIPMALMRDFLGTLIARILIKASRALPDLPLEESILALHDLVQSVQLVDINKKSDGRFVFSERVYIQWEATKKNLSQLWEHVLKRRKLATLNGPPEPASG
jgi:hypothetical protein